MTVLNWLANDQVQSFLIVFASTPLWAWFWTRGERWKFWLYILWISVISAALNALLEPFIHDRQWAIAANAAWLLIWLWHRWRGKRKRAAAWLGAKSRALRDGLVRKVRESMQPRPVPVPVPR